MDHFLKRVGISMLFFWGGVHFIGLGMFVNGYTSRQNPTWGMFQLLFTIEVAVIKFTALIVAGISLIVVIVRRRKPKPQIEIEPESKPIRAPRQRREPDESYLAAKPKPATVPTPRVLTPEELKERAIQQIMGRR